MHPCYVFPVDSKHFAPPYAVVEGAGIEFREFLVRKDRSTVSLRKLIHRTIVLRRTFLFITPHRWGQPINELQRCPSRVWSEGIYTHLSPVHAYEFLSRCRYSIPKPRQPMVELFVLASSCFPPRKSEDKSTPAESRTLKFRLSGRSLYPLVHGGSPL